MNRNLVLLRFLGYIFILFFVSSFLPHFFFITIVLYILSEFYRKRDVIFLFFIILALVFNLGGLFGQSAQIFIKIGPIKLSLLHIFSIVAFAKSLNLKSPQINLFKSFKPYYLVFLTIFVSGYFLIGNDGGGDSGLRHIYFILLLIPILLNFYSLPRIFNYNNINIDIFTSVAFIYLILNIGGQVLYIINGVQIGEIFKKQEVDELIVSDDLIRPIIGSQLMFMIYFISLYFQTHPVYCQKNNMKLNLIVLFSFISIFITGTRGWILALAFIYLMNTGINFRNKSIRNISFIGISIVLVLSFSTVLQQQIIKSIQRVMTLELLLKGDYTVGGTNTRLTDRSKPVMQLFYKKPILGWGFSKVGMDAKDVHVGNQQTLMESGLIGYLTILWVIFAMSRKIYKNHYFIKNKYRFYNNEILILLLIIPAIFIIHSSSTTIFGFMIYTKAFGNLFFLLVVLAIMNVLLNESRTFYYNHQLQPK